MAFNKAGIEHAAAEFGVGENFRIIGGGGLHPLQTHVIQRTQATVQRFLPGQCPDDQLQAHGVVIGRNAVTGVDRGIHAYARATRGVVAGDLAEGGQKVVLRILGIDAELDGKAAMLDVLLLDRQG